MIEELQQIDTSAIEELRKIKQDQEVLQDWLSKMEAKKGKVADAVFGRVLKDYEGRNAALEEKARPLKDRARAEYAKLRTCITRFEKALETATLDKEELEFRHEIGEFQGQEFEERLKASEARLTQCQADRAEADELKQRFIGVFHSEEDLALPPAPPPGRKPAPPPAEPEVTGAIGASPPSPVTPPPVAKGPHPAPPLAPTGDATIMIEKPHLSAQMEDGSTVDYPLDLQVMSIGRAPENRVRIQKDAVSRKHAEVVLGSKGYTIRDLKSENGTYVNGKRVTERLLADGDAIQIGSQKFVFHEG